MSQVSCVSLLMISVSCVSLLVTPVMCVIFGDTCVMCITVDDTGVMCVTVGYICVIVSDLGVQCVTVIDTDVMCITADVGEEDTGHVQAHAHRQLARPQAALHRRSALHTDGTSRVTELLCLSYHLRP